MEYCGLSAVLASHPAGDTLVVLALGAVPPDYATADQVVSNGLSLPSAPLVPDDGGVIITDDIAAVAGRAIIRSADAAILSVVIYGFAILSTADPVGVVSYGGVETPIDVRLGDNVLEVSIAATQLRSLVGA